MVTKKSSNVIHVDHSRLSFSIKLLEFICKTLVLDNLHFPGRKIAAA